MKFIDGKPGIWFNAGTDKSVAEPQEEKSIEEIPENWRKRRG